MERVHQLIAQFNALSVGDAEYSGSAQTVQGTASSPADMPHTVPQDPCSTSPHRLQDPSTSTSCGDTNVQPYLRTMSTEGTGIGRQAGPSDHNIIQSTISAQDLSLSLSPPYLLTMSTEGTGIGRQAGPSDHNNIRIVQGTASTFADMPQTVAQDPCSSSPHVTQKRSLGATMFCGDDHIREEDIDQRAKKRLSSEVRLEPQHKVFLSHSGKQKAFTTLFCEGLEKRGHEPFFDKRDASLEKGDKFGELIIKAVKECEMLVVVVSEDYFISKWPMIELSAFVQARKQRSTANSKEPKVFPLFYQLSIKEVHNEENRQKWYTGWKKQFEGDERIKLEDWKEAVEQLPSFNGIPYNQGDLEVYREAIVKSICFSIPPSKHDVDDVQGKASLCKAVREMINKCNVFKTNKAKVIGFHGVGGGGKTTMCKVLCNEFTNDFGGRVCHLEFKSKDTDLEKLLRKALVSLANFNDHDVEGLGEDQCLARLRKVLGEKKVFLAIDNVWDDDELDSIRKATKLMQGPFHEESVVVVTSRSLGTLQALSIDEKSCFEVPELGEVDAMNLFKYYAFPEKKSLSEVEEEYVLKCVERCHFEKGNGQRHFHPLALKALGMQFGNPSLKNLLQLEAKLQKVMAFDHRFGGNELFGILKIGFDELSEDDQNLFMDVADFGRKVDICDTKWLSCVHEKNKDELQMQLDILKRRGFLQHLDWTSQEVEMHDLYMEFALKEIYGTFNKLDVCKTQKWMQIKVFDPKMKRKRKWSKLTRLNVDDFKMNVDEPVDLEILRDWDLQYFSRVEVLHLRLFSKGSSRLGILNLEPMKCLRSIFVFSLEARFCEVKGMERIQQLYHFSWHFSRQSWKVFRGNSNICSEGLEDVKAFTTMGKFPPSLKMLQIKDSHASLCSSAVDQCTRLEYLRLRCILPTTMDLSKFSALMELSITRMKNEGLSQLFNQICGLHHLVFLKKLKLKCCEMKCYEVDGQLEVNLQNLTRLQELSICNCRLQIGCLPPHIQRLRLSQGRDLNEDFVSILKTSALKDLEVLELNFQKNFKGSTDFMDVGRWPRLQTLKLRGCNILKLPDLRESTELKTLFLGKERFDDGEFCYDDEFQIGEGEVAMLARLPRLEPVCVAYTLEEFVDSEEDAREDEVLIRIPYKYIVDFSRRVLIKQEAGFMSVLERELGIAPYNLNTFKENW